MCYYFTDTVFDMLEWSVDSVIKNWEKILLILDWSSLQPTKKEKGKRKTQFSQTEEKMRFHSNKLDRD